MPSYIPGISASGALAPGLSAATVRAVLELLSSTEIAASYATTSYVDDEITAVLGSAALTTNPLSQFAATTSAQLRGVLSDETGTGALVFAGGNIGAATGTTFVASGAVTANNFAATSIGSSFGAALFDATAAINVRPNLASRTAIVIRLQASQTADAIQVQNSAGTVLAAVSATGEVWSGASTSAYVGPTRVSWGAGANGGGSITNGAITVGSNSRFRFGSGNGISAGDAAFSRIGVGVVGLGNDTLADASAELRLGTLVVNGVAKFTGYPTGLLPSAASNAGSITYDTTLAKHVGCDGTNWNALW